MKRGLIIAALFVVAFVLTHEREITLGPGAHAPDIPVQVNLTNAGSFPFDEYRITPLAEFDLTGKILSRKRYRSGREADLSPIDFALGWGRMSDEEVLEHFSISQSGRWYYWRAKELPIPQTEASSSSANMHLIPADETVKDALIQMRKGEVVHLKGKLVLVTADDGWKWKSSMTRKDRGNHACEVFYVESANVRDV